MRFQLTLPRMVIIKRQAASSQCCRLAGRPGPSCSAAEEVTHRLKTLCTFLKTEAYIYHVTHRSTHRYLPKRNGSVCAHRTLNSDVHGSIHSSQKKKWWEEPKGPLAQDKQDVRCLYSRDRAILSPEKEWAPDMHPDVDALRNGRKKQ